jgi:hypothetical protein
VSAKYLLPCRCGQQVVIETRQAGQTVVCPCGESLPVPTMLEIIALEPAPEESLSTSNGEGWGWPQRLLLLGGACLLAGMLFALLFWLDRPIAPIDTLDPEYVRRSAEKLPPSVTWHYWAMMKQGLDRRIDQRYADLMTIYHFKQTFAGILVLAGVSLAGVGMAKRKGERERGKEEG